MEHLIICDSVVNCPICRNNGLAKHFPNQYINEFIRRMHVFRDSPSNDYKLKKKKSVRNTYEQIYRKLLKTPIKSTRKVRKHHKKNPSSQIYQVYTLKSDKQKIKKNESVYSYPYSSSSSDESTIEKPIKKISKIPTRRKKSSSEVSTDSEFDTCEHFPITEKHYQHIINGVECSTRKKTSILNTTKKPSISDTKKPSILNTKKKPKKKRKIYKKPRENELQEEFQEEPQETEYKIPAYFPDNFKESIASNSYACKQRLKKKCNCKNKCAPHIPEEDELTEDRSDSEISEKTLIKFINSLHSYVTKTKKMNHKHKKMDIDSSCTLCHNDHNHNQKKKSSKREPKQAHIRKTEPESIFKRYFRE